MTALAPHKLAYNVPEAAAALGLSRSTVFEMLADGRLKGFMLAGRRLIRRAELLRAIRAAEAEARHAA